MGKQLYIVRIETEVVVLAESPEDAEHEARYGHIDDEPEVSAEPMRYMPGGWERGSLVYGAEGDQELGTLIDQGFAPKYTALLAQLEKAKTNAQG